MGGHITGTARRAPGMHFWAAVKERSCKKRRESFRALNLSASSANSLDDNLNEYIECIESLLLGKMKQDVPNVNDGDNVLIDSRFYQSELQYCLRTLIKQVVERENDITIIAEENHVDPSFRSIFYKYFSSRFFDMGRRSIRLSFFKGMMSFDEFLEGTTFDDLERSPNGHERSSGDLLNSKFLGACVLDPIGRGVIGRTLMSPECFIENPSYIRLSEYEFTVYGKRLCVEAFPYRQQDGEALRCAEVSMLNLTSYYSNEYSDYGRILPADIIEYEEQFLHERATPSKGINYEIFSKILSHVGFSPRLYNATETEPARWSGLKKDGIFRRQLFWYLDSGIPVAVNVNPKMEYMDGHSLVCIGFESLDANIRREYASYPSMPLSHDAEALLNSAMEEAYHPVHAIFDDPIEAADEEADRMDDEVECCLLHSVDFHQRCITIDDGKLPYNSAAYPHLSSDELMAADNYVVALHKGMALDAEDAYAAFVTILCSSSLGVCRWGKEVLRQQSGGAKVVMRMVLASTRSYKRARSADHGDALWRIYAYAPMPHFVWVMELYLLNDYFSDADQRRAFAEIVLDATSGGKGEPADKIVLMRYPGRIIARGPDEPFPTKWMAYASNACQGSRGVMPFDRNLNRVDPGRASK